MFDEAIAMYLRHLEAKRRSASTIRWYQEQFAAYVAEVVDGWIGVVGADDKPLPYTTANLAQLLQAYPAAGAEIVRRYTQQLSHARAGN
jgi:hypothetical protein